MKHLTKHIAGIKGLKNMPNLKREKTENLDEISLFLLYTPLQTIQLALGPIHCFYGTLLQTT